MNLKLEYVSNSKYSTSTKKRVRIIHMHLQGVRLVITRSARWKISLIHTHTHTHSQAAALCVALVATAAATTATMARRRRRHNNNCACAIKWVIPVNYEPSAGECINHHTNVPICRGTCARARACHALLLCETHAHGWCGGVPCATRVVRGGERRVRISVRVVVVVVTCSLLVYGWSHRYVPPQQRERTDYNSASRRGRRCRTTVAAAVVVIIFVFVSSS